MANKMRSVKWQKLREVNVRGFTGNKSPYWDWCERFGRVGEEGELREFSVANPDIIPDEDSGPLHGRETRDLMRQAVQRAKLSISEKQVLECLGTWGFSDVKTAEILGISRRSVRVLLSRAQKKCYKIFVAISRD